MEYALKKTLVKELYGCCNKRAEFIIRMSDEVDGGAELEKDIADYVKENEERERKTYEQ
jgi:hypothetical protein